MNKKRVIILHMLFILLLSIPLTASANTGEVVTPEVKAALEKTEDEAGILNGFLIGIVRDLFDLEGISSINTLVFGNPFSVWISGPNSNGPILYGLFYEAELTKIIKPLIVVFASCYVSFVAISIMIAALKFGLKAYSPQAKADFWSDIQMWVLSAFFMGTFGFILELMFEANMGLVQTLSSLLQNNFGVNPNGLSVIASAGAGFIFGLGDVMILLVEWGLALYLNFIYIARKIIIILLIVMAPVAAISLLYAKTRAFFGSWMKEILGNIFLQSIHALVLGVFAGLASMGAGPIFKIGMILMFVPVTGLISKWLDLGDSSTTLGRTTAMMGMAGVGGALMLAKGAGAVMSRSRQGGNSSQGSGSSQENMGQDAGTTSITEAAKGTHSGGWQRAKSAASMVGAGAGALVGLPFGGAGVAVGGYLGSKVGGGVLQASRNASASLVSTTRTLGTPMNMGKQSESGGLKGKMSQYSDGAKKMWGDLSSRRQFFGNMGESIGSAVGASSIGRSVGHMMSGVSSNRIQSEQFGGKTLADYSKENPGASMQWRQDSQGSAFYMQKGNDWARVSPIGKADDSLKKGEERRVDYNLNNGSNWDLQGNGSYTASEGSQPPSFAGGSSSGRKTVGLSGSTSNLGRSSQAYIMGKDGQKFVDTRMDAKDVNPDQYFSHNLQGSPQKRHWSDKGADLLSRTNTQNASSWIQNQSTPPQHRHSGVV